MSTKERILDAAEQLFSQHGYAATSLRAITSRAGVNLAAINYHFRSKEALLEAVLVRRLGRINQKRIEMLRASEAASEGPPALEALVEAFVVPAFYLGVGTGGLASPLPRLLGRIYLEPSQVARRILRQQSGEIASRSIAAFRRALPELPEIELLWRLHFSVGAMAHTLVGGDALYALSAGRCDLSEVAAVVRRLVSFAVAGLRAPMFTEKTRQTSEGAHQ